jgi:hypothetical protein
MNSRHKKASSCLDGCSKKLRQPTAMNIRTKLPGTQLQPGDEGVAAALIGIPLLLWS